MHFGGAKMRVGQDADFGEAGGDVGERMERNYPIFGDGVMVGVELERIAPVNAVGNGHGEEKSGVADDFDETVSRIEEKQVAVVGVLKSHDLGFEIMLALLQGDAGGREILRLGGSGGEFLLFDKLVDGGFELE